MARIFCIQNGGPLGGSFCLEMSNQKKVSFEVPRKLFALTSGITNMADFPPQNFAEHVRQFPFLTFVVAQCGTLRCASIFQVKRWRLQWSFFGQGHS